jgi:exodeoxyribonuclease VII small subunit
MSDKKNLANLQFEEALKKLENIVEMLERGKLSLDDALKYYEEGIALTRFLTVKLQQVEKKVEELIKDKEGNLKLKPLELNSIQKI